MVTCQEDGFSWERNWSPRRSNPHAALRATLALMRRARVRKEADMDDTPLPSSKGRGVGGEGCRIDRRMEARQTVAHTRSDRAGCGAVVTHPVSCWCPYLDPIGLSTRIKHRFHGAHARFTRCAGCGDDFCLGRPDRCRAPRTSGHYLSTCHTPHRMRFGRMGESSE
jgi:hypothetical protein